MRLTIKNPETDRLARELASEMGVTITAAVTIAVRERLRRIRADPEVGVTPASDDPPTRDRDRGRRP